MTEPNDAKDPSPFYSTAKDNKNGTTQPWDTGADPQSLALMPAGLEVVPPIEHPPPFDHSGKEAFQIPESSFAPPPNAPELTIEADQPPSFSHRRITQKRICGLKGSIFCLLLVLFVLAIALALGIGLGVGLALDHGSQSSTTFDSTNSTNSTGSAVSIGGSLNAAYYSRRGAWNGTSLAVAQQISSSESSSEHLLFFQHHSGDVRWMQLASNGSWLGGSSSEVVARDAKNSTPIAAVSCVSEEGTSTTHVFYVDAGNTIREFTKPNTSTEWRDGPLGDAALHPFAADLASMQACLASTSTGSPAIRIWYASSNSTYEEYLWRPSESAWTWQRQWKGYSGTAGIACNVQVDSSVTYVALVNAERRVEIWSKKVSDSSVGGSAGWEQTLTINQTVLPTTSLTYADFLYVQTADSDHIHAYNVTWSGGETPGHDDQFSIEGERRVANSRFAAAAVIDADGDDVVLFLDQQDGDDITQHARGLDGGDGEWRSIKIEIPE